MVSIAGRLARRRGSLAALVASLVLLAVIVAQQVLLTLLTSISTLGLDTSAGAIVAGIWMQAARFAVGGVLPFVAGTFISLWLIAPIASQLRLTHVITRSILAGAVGASVVLVVMLIVAVTTSWGLSGPMFAYSFPSVTWAGLSPLDSLVRSLQAAVAAFVGWLPHTVLVGLSVWTWLDRHPTRHAVSGLIDEV